MDNPDPHKRTTRSKRKTVDGLPDSDVDDGADTADHGKKKSAKAAKASSSAKSGGAGKSKSAKDNDFFNRANNRLKQRGVDDRLVLKGTTIGQGPGAMAAPPVVDKEALKRARKDARENDRKISTGMRAESVLGTERERPPRSYGDERERQVLRWVASSLKALYPKGIEVQCYFDKPRDRIYISSNVDSENTKLAEYLESHKNDVISAVSAGFEALVSEGGSVKRKTLKLIGREDDHDSDQDLVYACLRGGKVEVVKPKDGQVPGFHAERRIGARLAELGIDRLDHELLGGVRRACALCAQALGFLGKVRAGPAWLSDAGIGPTDPEDYANSLADHIANCEILYSSITRGKDGLLTLDEDSQSSSDGPDESEVRKKIRKKPEK